MTKYADTNLADLPRVLILGQTFTNDTGGGVTLSNLFKGWPKEKLAIAIESKEGADFNKTDNYYRIGYEELKMPLPFSLLQRKTKSGYINSLQPVGAIDVKETASIKFRLKNYLDGFLHSSGLFYWMYGNQNISSSLLEWITKFNPDLIYYQPNAFKSIPFAIALKKHFEVPMVSHVMDDWFSFAVRPGLLKKYWEKRLDQRVRELFEATDLHLSICKYMSAEYLKRYGYDFVPFHNCVDPDFWAAGRSNPKPDEMCFNILYAGRLGYGLEQIILKIADTIEKMGNKGLKVSLEIQTKDQRHELIGKLKDYRHVRVSNSIKYAELPVKFNSADVLLIPADFNGKGMEFIRFSMPTKVSEYMATSTPVWVIGPPDTALTEYAAEGWAQLCQVDSKHDIEQSLVELMRSQKKRETIAAKAEQIVKQNHDEKVVVPLFREMLKTAVNKYELKDQAGR